MAILVELHGLEVFGRHGVLPEESAAGQTFLFDVEVEAPDGALSDRIEDAVDYRDVAKIVGAVSEGTRFHLLEPLAAAVAERLLDSLEIARVRVRVRKPRPLGVAAEWSAATVERRR